MAEEIKDMTIEEACSVLRVPAAEAKATLKLYAAAQTVVGAKGAVAAMEKREADLNRAIVNLEDEQTERERQNKTSTDLLTEGLTALVKRRDALVEANTNAEREHKTLMDQLEIQREARLARIDQDCKEQTDKASVELKQITAQLETARTELKKIRGAIGRLQSVASVGEDAL